MIWVCVCGHLVCGSRAAVGSIVGALRARFRPFVIGRATGRSATRRRRPCSSFLFFCGCIQVALSIPVRSDGSHSIFCSPFFFVLTGRHFCSLVAPPTHRKQQNKIGWFFFFLLQVCRVWPSRPRKWKKKSIQFETSRSLGLSFSFAIWKKMNRKAAGQVESLKFGSSSRDSLNGRTKKKCIQQRSIWKQVRRLWRCRRPKLKKRKEKRIREMKTGGIEWRRHRVR